MKIVEYAKQIKKALKTHNKIFITGHKNLDLDAIGACFGFASICKKFKKEYYIIIDDENHEPGVKKLLSENTDINFIKSNDVQDLKTGKDLLVIVDTNKKNLIQSEILLTLFNEFIIIDHHATNYKTINIGIKIIDNEASSTCEMITDLAKEYKIKFSEKEATYLLSGIVLDTNNFVLKTTSNTYKNAYYLTTFNADPKRVQYYLKQSINDYILRQDLIKNIKIVKGNIAVTTGNPEIKYRREELAKMADTLLQFNEINASFVLGKIDERVIGLSARSIEDYDVSVIVEKMGGGGDKTDAAAQIQNTDEETELRKLMEIINGVD